MKGFPRRFFEAFAPIVIVGLMMLTPLLAAFLAGGIYATFWGFVGASGTTLMIEAALGWLLNEYFLPSKEKR